MTHASMPDLAEDVDARRCTVLAGVAFVARSLFRDDETALRDFLARRDVAPSPVALAPCQRRRLRKLAVHARRMMADGTVDRMDAAYASRRGEAFVDYLTRRVCRAVVPCGPPPLVRTKTRAFA